MRAVQVLGAVLALSVVSAPCEALTSAQIDAGAKKAGKGLKRVLKQLSSDRVDGRDNASPGSVLAQKILHKRLERIGDGLGPAPDPYAQPYESNGTPGTNLLAVIPGRELPDEFVILGAHYDHLAEGACTPEIGDPDDVICNGAADNASGADVVLAVGRAIAKLREAPRRSVVVALWDSEEDPFRGSAYYVANPLVPLAQTTAYVNLDVLGVSQLPSLSQNTLVLATETGGEVLRGAADAAVGAQGLAASFFSYVFGESRSDYAAFGEAGVPTVYFSDGPYPCYHSAGDEVRRIDFKKLAEESAIVFRTVVGLAEGDTVPVFVPPTGAATYEDAQAFDDILTVTVPADLDLYPPADQAEIVQFAADFAAIVADGPAAFDDADSDAVLFRAATLSSQIPELGCPAF